MSQEICLPVDDIINSYVHQTTNVKCKTHQVLNKYYLKNKNIFVCEYCGFDNDGPDSFMHMPQILEKYHDEIINLQRHPEYFIPNEFLRTLPDHLKSTKKLNMELSKFNYEYQDFMVGLLPKMMFFVKYKYSLYEIKDLINEVKFTPERKPDLQKIGNYDNKESKLIMLAQYLVSQGVQKNEKINLTESLKKFLEEYQLKMVDLIFLSLEFLQTGYNEILPEIAKLEKRNIGEIPNRDYLLSHITNKKDTELMIQNYLQIIKGKDDEIILLNDSLKNEKFRNTNLEETIKDLNKKLIELQNSIKSKEKLYRERIDELEHTIFSLRQEVEDGGKESLRQQQELIKRFKLSHEEELNKYKAEMEEQKFKQNKEFEVKLIQMRNHNIEIENNYKSIEFLINDSINQANVKRIQELELILEDERDRNHLLSNEYDEKLKHSNDLYINTAREFDDYKKGIAQYDIRLNDLTNECNFLSKENKILKKNLKDKDAFIKKTIDDDRNERLLEKERNEEIQNKLSQSYALNENYQKELQESQNYKKYYDMYLPLKKENDTNILDRVTLLNNNKNLQSHIDLQKKEYQNKLQELERDNLDLRNNYEKSNSLNYNLNLQLASNNRKLELIKKSSEQLKQDIKPFPWIGNENLVKRNGVSHSSQ
jgi:hypothetical protein